MLSANVSAFSIRKAVGGGAAPVPYILEFRIIGGGGSTSNWLYAAGGAAAGAFANYTVTEVQAVHMVQPRGITEAFMSRHRYKRKIGLVVVVRGRGALLLMSGMFQTHTPMATTEAIPLPAAIV